MDFNSDFRYDLSYGQVEGETWFHKILSNSTIEVKTDRMTSVTGNIYIEYESRGKPSGIATTQAKYWVYKISEETAIVIKTDELKKRLRQLVKKGKGTLGVKGGDNDTSIGVLVKATDILLLSVGYNL